jgi:glycosyltransferase involved in cell wall biosynthesis
MRVVIIRTMAQRSIDVVSDNLVTQLKKVYPHWEIIELTPQPFDVKDPNLWVRFQKYYERYWRYPNFVTQQVADIFHIIEPRDAHIAYWLKRKGKPTVVTCHDIANIYFQDNLKDVIEVPLVSRNAWLHSVKGMKVANHVIAVSTATARDTTELLAIAPADITVIPNAVEAIFESLPQEQIDRFRQTLGVAPATFCLLNVGTNHPRKNILRILQAIAILVETGLSFQFWKVGEDFTAEQQDFIQSHQLCTYIKYLGEPDKSTLVQIYNAADALLAPSLFEGFGITILEAMACGTPAITANVSAMPEVAGDAGILVDPRNSQAIADAVIHLHRDADDYQELVAKGLARTKLFTWERTAMHVADVYQKVLDR